MIGLLLLGVAVYLIVLTGAYAYRIIFTDYVPTTHELAFVLTSLTYIFLQRLAME